ncbi:MFS transporter [Microbacterium sp. C5A9]|uniref:MFS transporter n=1 Tax=Microbacterium sp. C5A9 TaxID=2736663 RepID=UPI001F521CD1|nr:MFS transporter [Microbacterium sp. C5A9]MCI1020134.1 MFS transporter [Microbacterium sp. C5A9]
MTATDLTTRVPLRPPTATATFAIGIAGYLGVNLSPYMITAAQTGLGIDVLAASWLVTATLLLTAVTGLTIAPLCAGAHRRTVARTGLGIATLGFLTAALLPSLMIPALLVGGVGAGGAVAASGAALAAFRNPDRVAGFNGLANRGVITIVLAVIPLIGLAPIDVFGALALFSILGLVVSAWLPAAPVVDPQAAAAVAEAMPIEIPPTGAVRVSPARSRAVTVAGFGLLVVFALWAVSEDSLWAMAGVMGAEQTGLTPEGLGIALSGATAGGLIGSVLLMIVGSRLGRAVPLAVLLIAGGALKIVEGFTTDPTAFIVVFVAWNTVYAIAFMYFVSTSAALDSDGRWSGPLLAVYLVGSALTPVIGAALVGALGFQGFAVALGIASFVLAVPASAIALLSTRLERATTTQEMPR